MYAPNRNEKETEEKKITKEGRERKVRAAGRQRRYKQTPALS